MQNNTDVNVLLDEIIKNDTIPYYEPPVSYRVKKHPLKYVAYESGLSMEDVLHELSKRQLSASEIVRLSDAGSYPIEAFYWTNVQAMEPSAWLALFIGQLKYRRNDAVFRETGLNVIIRDMLSRAVWEDDKKDFYRILSLITIDVFSSEAPTHSKLSISQKNKHHIHEEPHPVYGELHSFILSQLFNDLDEVNTDEITACLLLMNDPAFKFRNENRVLTDYSEPYMKASEVVKLITSYQVNPTKYAFYKDKTNRGGSDGKNGRKSDASIAMRAFDKVHDYNRKHKKPPQIQYSFNKQLLSFIKTYVVATLD